MKYNCFEFIISKFHFENFSKDISIIHRMKTNFNAECDIEYDTKLIPIFNTQPEI